MRWLTATLSAAALLTVGSSHAFNTKFLKDAPVSKFSTEDIALLTKTARKALDEAPDGAIESCENEATGSGGSIKPLCSFERSASKCRRARFDIHHKTLKGSSTHTFCRQSDGDWRVAQ